MEFRMLLKFLSTIGASSGLQNRVAHFCWAGTTCRHHWFCGHWRWWQACSLRLEKNASARKIFQPLRKMESPLDALDDCAGNHYRLQLNMNKYILETYYGLQAASMYIVSCHPDNWPEAFVDKVPNLGSHVQEIMQKQRRKNHSLAMTVPEGSVNCTSDIAGGRLLELPCEVLKLILVHVSDPSDLSFLLGAASLFGALAFSRSTWQDEILHLWCLQGPRNHRAGSMLQLFQAWGALRAVETSYSQLHLLHQLHERLTFDGPQSLLRAAQQPARRSMVWSAYVWLCWLDLSFSRRCATAACWRHKCKEPSSCAWGAVHLMLTHAPICGRYAARILAVRADASSAAFFSRWASACPKCRAPCANPMASWLVPNRDWRASCAVAALAAREWAARTLLRVFLLLGGATRTG